MAHSIELLFDQDSDVAVREIWRELAEVGLPSHLNVRSGTNRPHVTLVAADRINSDVDERLRDLGSQFPFPLPCRIGAPLIFGEGRLTLVRCIVPSARLLALHDAVYQRCLPFVPNEPFAHCAAGQWSPHTTLGRRLTADQIGEALAKVAGISRDIAATAVGLRRWDSDKREEHVLIG